MQHLLIETILGKLEFKVIGADEFDPSDIDKSRRNAYVIYDNNSTKFQVEISSYEYTDPKMHNPVKTDTHFARRRTLILSQTG